MNLAYTRDCGLHSLCLGMIRRVSSPAEMNRREMGHPVLPNPPAVSYQILTRSAGARYSFSPGCTSKAAYQASRLRTSNARYLPGE